MPINGNNSLGIDYSLFNNKPKQYIYDDVSLMKAYQNAMNTSLNPSALATPVENSSIAAVNPTGASAAIDPTLAIVGMAQGVLGNIGHGLTNYATTSYGNRTNSTYADAVLNGSDEAMDAASQQISSGITDFSGVKNINNLMSSWNDNTLQNIINNPTTGEKAANWWGETFNNLAEGPIGTIKQIGHFFGSLFGDDEDDRVEELNNQIRRANRTTSNSFKTAARNAIARNNRDAFMHQSDEGGLLNEFNTGGSHEENPLGGIPQGIASDGLPNLVEEGEVRSDFDDAKIFNNQDRNYTITEKDCEKYLLPKSVISCNPAEAIKKLKKEYEDRVNDPISIATMKEWDSRVFAFQEDKTAKIEENRAKKAIKNMSDEEKAALLSSLGQPMAQQEGIDLSQPMYAKGGKIHIAKNKRGTFTAAAKKHGKSVQAFASQVLANKENYSPAMVKKANFARNAAKWHADGGHLFDDGGYYPWQLGYLYDNNILEREKPITSIPLVPYQTRVLRDPLLERKYMLPVEINADKVTPNVDKLKPATNSIQAPTIPIHDEQVAPTVDADFDIEHPVDKGYFNTEYLRYAPAVGAGIGALIAGLQPIDYSLPNELRRISSRINPISAPAIGGYRRYTPYDVNLGDAENLALTAAALNANKGQNRATQGALNSAVLAKSQEASAKRNLAAQQANEANRLSTDTYNLGIDQTNANLAQAYDQLNSQRLMQRLGIEQAAAQAADASRTAWSNMFNTTHENLWNQLGNVGRDEWNRNQFMLWLAQHPATAKAMGIEV